MILNTMKNQKISEIIRQQSNRLNTIVDDLLTLSRIERKEEHIVFDLFPLEKYHKKFHCFVSSPS